MSTALPVSPAPGHPRWPALIPPLLVPVPDAAREFTFIRSSPELQTAYTDTLGDLALGMSGGLLAAVGVTLLADRQ